MIERRFNKVYCERKVYKPMNNTIKSLGFCIMVGAAYKAGYELWDECLSEKVHGLASKLKKKEKSNKAIRYKDYARKGR